MPSNNDLAACLAIVLLSGPWDRDELERRVRAALGDRSGKRAKSLVNAVLTAVPTPYAPSQNQLQRLLREERVLKSIGQKVSARLLALDLSLPAPEFSPIAKFENLDVPKIETQGDLARWLDVPVTQIDWLTDERRTLHRAGEARLHHYSCRWLPKRNGGWRLIEAPKGRTKHYQRRILREILDRAPVSPAAYGFVKRRNGAQAAATHAGEAVVVSLDLQNFFLSIKASRVHALFRCLGYPAPVARMLTSLCITSTPKAVLVGRQGDGGPDRATRERYRVPHLPQGAPTSPALANFAAHALDARLTGLARIFGARYTRYADDLTFSGGAEFLRRADRFIHIAGEIAKDEGFAINAAKTRVMTRSVRQTVTGLVVNDHINVPRSDYDRLKATLTNCVRYGPEGQNRNAHHDFCAHLDGRIAWVESINLRRGTKLRRLFDSIRWQ